MYKIKVIFRKDKDNNVIAFLPEIRANYGNIMSYMHIGQHGESSYGFYHTTKRAKPNEYAELLKELQKIYYDCKLIVENDSWFSDNPDVVEVDELI